VSAHTVKLSRVDGSVTYITARKARALRKDDKVSVVSTKPFELRLRTGCESPDLSGMQRWSTHSDGVKMNGAVIMRRAPRP
jgi:hypothetical protein